MGSAGSPLSKYRPPGPPGCRDQLAGDRPNLISGDSAEPVLPAGPAHLGDFISDVAMIPAQTTRDLVHRDATNEHLAQRVHLRIRPLSAGIHGQRFVICRGPARIED